VLTLKRRPVSRPAISSIRLSDGLHRRLTQSAGAGQAESLVARRRPARRQSVRCRATAPYGAVPGNAVHANWLASVNCGYQVNSFSGDFTMGMRSEHLLAHVFPLPAILRSAAAAWLPVRSSRSGGRRQARRQSHRGSIRGRVANRASGDQS